MTASTPAGRASILVAKSQDLQSAITTADPGDTILLQAGVTFVGNFVLPPREDTSSGYVTLRSSTADTELPGERCPHHAGVLREAGQAALSERLTGAVDGASRASLPGAAPGVSPERKWSRHRHRARRRLLRAGFARGSTPGARPRSHLPARRRQLRPAARHCAQQRRDQRSSTPTLPTSRTRQTRRRLPAGMVLAPTSSPTTMWSRRGRTWSLAPCVRRSRPGALGHSADAQPPCEAAGVEGAALEDSEPAGAQERRTSPDRREPD